MPKAIAMGGHYSLELFNRKGELRNIRRLKFWGVCYVCMYSTPVFKVADIARLVSGDRYARLFGKDRYARLCSRELHRAHIIYNTPVFEVADLARLVSSGEGCGRGISLAFWVLVGGGLWQRSKRPGARFRRFVPTETHMHTQTH
jgi:hypothetical protein